MYAFAALIAAVDTLVVTGALTGAVVGAGAVAATGTAATRVTAAGARLGSCSAAVGMLSCCPAYTKLGFDNDGFASYMRVTVVLLARAMPLSVSPVCTVTTRGTGVGGVAGVVRLDMVTLVFGIRMR